MNADQAFQQALALSKNYTNESLEGGGALKGDKGDKGDPGKDGLPGKDGVTYIPQIGSVTTVQPTENASASVDIDEEIHTARFNFEIPKGEDGVSGGSGEFPDLYTTTEIPTAESVTAEDKLLLGTADGNKVVQNKMFMDFLRENGLFDLDGQGRKLLPGYGIVSKKVKINLSNGVREFVICSIEDLLGNIPVEDVVLCVATPILDGANDACSTFIDIDKKAVTGIWHYTPNAEVPNKDMAVTAIYKKPVPFEPGLKTISIRKNMTVSNHTGIACQLSETGITDPSIIVSMSAISYSFEGITNVYAFLNNQNVMIYYPGSTNTYVDQDIRIDILVKDYSSIGPSIVTEGIRMIAKEFAGINVGSGWTHKEICSLSNFDGVTAEQVVGFDITLIGCDDSFMKYFNGDSFAVTRFNTGSAYSNLTAKVSLFVKVPVVEQKLKPFTKDVEVTLNGTKGVFTGVFLDGSDDVGGFTPDNLHVYSSTPLTAGKWVINPTINVKNEIIVCGADAGQTGPCKIRIHIE